MQPVKAGIHLPQPHSFGAVVAEEKAAPPIFSGNCPKK
jgi:hypothetical protein